MSDFSIKAEGVYKQYDIGGKKVDAPYTKEGGGYLIDVPDGKINKDDILAMLYSGKRGKINDLIKLLRKDGKVKEIEIINNIMHEVEDEWPIYDKSLGILFMDNHKVGTNSYKASCAIVDFLKKVGKTISYDNAMKMGTAVAIGKSREGRRGAVNPYEEKVISEAEQNREWKEIWQPLFKELRKFPKFNSEAVSATQNYLKTSGRNICYENSKKLIK